MLIINGIDTAERRLRRGRRTASVRGPVEEEGAEGAGRDERHEAPFRGTGDSTSKTLNTSFII